MNRKLGKRKNKKEFINELQLKREEKGLEIRSNP